MSPTIMRELMRVKLSLTANHVEVGRDGNVFRFGASDMIAYAKGCYGIRGRVSPVKFLIAEMPERRYYEEMEREEDARRAAGGRVICPECGERTAREDVCKTLGSPRRSHPGDEYTAILRCESNACGKVSM